MKAYHDVMLHAMVTLIDPMTRGLKVINPTDVVNSYDVTLIDPMTRGLKGKKPTFQKPQED